MAYRSTLSGHAITLWCISSVIRMASFMMVYCLAQWSSFYFFAEFLVKMFFFSFCLHGTSPVLFIDIGDRCGTLNQPQDVFFNDKLIFFVCLFLKSFIRHPILLSNCKSFLWHSLYLNSFLPAFLHRKLTFKLMILFFLFALQISLTAKRQSKIQSKNLLITISKNHGN